MFDWVVFLWWLLVALGLGVLIIAVLFLFFNTVSAVMDHLGL